MHIKISRLLLTGLLTTVFTACGSPSDSVPGFTPAQVSTYNDAVSALAPQYGEDPESVIRQGREHPGDLNRAEGPEWEYVVPDPRRPTTSSRLLDSIFGQGHSCISVSARGVFWYGQTSPRAGDGRIRCQSLRDTLAAADPVIFKLSPNGKRWESQSLESSS